MLCNIHAILTKKNLKIELFSYAKIMPGQTKI